MLNIIKKLFFLWTKDESNTKKRKYVQFAMLICFLSGFISLDGYLDYKAISGDLPPHRPIIGIRGIFTTHSSKGITHIKLSGDVIYPDTAITYDNVPYIFYKREELSVTGSSIYHFIKEHANETVIVYGFILENGHGNFYPIKITNLRGMAYTSNLINDLLSEREYDLRVLNYKIFFFALSIIVLIHLSFKAIREDQTNKP